MFKKLGILVVSLSLAGCASGSYNYGNRSNSTAEIAKGGLIGAGLALGGWALGSAFGKDSDNRAKVALARNDTYERLNAPCAVGPNGEVTRITKVGDSPVIEEELRVKTTSRKCPEGVIIPPSDPYGVTLRQAQNNQPHQGAYQPQQRPGWECRSLPAPRADECFAKRGIAPW